MSNTLEEFRERLKRWDELCWRYWELYRRYVRLAEFRSKKCYFPGENCVRSWKRTYTATDLDLVKRYLEDVAPLCNEFIKTLYDVEYRFRRLAVVNVENLDEGPRVHEIDENHKIVQIHLKEPTRIYLALWGNRWYVVWGEFGGLPKKGQVRANVIERKIVDLVMRYRRGEKTELQVEEHEFKDEYERFQLEVPLPRSVSKLMRRKDKAPVALFRNLGWLLSDDTRQYLLHGAGNPGQMALRLYDWIMLARYGIKALKLPADRPLVFKLEIKRLVVTTKGVNPTIIVRPIVTAMKIISAVYDAFGLRLGKSEEVIMRGYAVLKALREAAFKREYKMCVVNDVGAWIAYSATVATLILGDGGITPFEIKISAKNPPRTGLDGTFIRAKELASAIGGTPTRQGEVVLTTWQMRLMLPVAPTPAFEKTAKLLWLLANYPPTAIVSINGEEYILFHRHIAKFTIGLNRGARFYEQLKKIGIRVKINKQGQVMLTYRHLRELRQRGYAVRILNEAEKERYKRVAPVLPTPDVETVKEVLKEVAKLAKISIIKEDGRDVVKIVPYEREKLEEIASILESAGIAISVIKSRKTIKIYQQRMVKVIIEAMKQFFNL